MGAARSLLLVLVIPFFASLAFAGSECPLGKNEDHLTIQRVMLNFGHFTSDAESVALRGYNGEAVQDADLSDSVAKLQVTQACAEAVLANPTGDLLPSVANSISDDAKKAEFVQDFTYFMEQFRDEVVVFRGMFATMLTQKPEQRDYKALWTERNNLNDIIDHAHRKTSDSTSGLHSDFVGVGNLHFDSARMQLMDSTQSVPSLKQNMKQINALMKSIVASQTDASKNADNAAAAGQMAALFFATQNQVPDQINEMPEGQRSAAFADYQQMIGQMVQLCQQLQAAFQNGDAGAAANILNQLNQGKHDGHDKYNP